MRSAIEMRAFAAMAASVVCRTPHRGFIELHNMRNQFIVVKLEQSFRVGDDFCLDRTKGPSNLATLLDWLIGVIGLERSGIFTTHFAVGRPHCGGCKR